MVVEVRETGMFDDEWPYSERVYVLTSATQNDVAHWLERLSPDRVDEDIPWSKAPSAFPSLFPGIKVYAVTLLTRSSSDSERVPKLKVENWSV